MESSKSENNQNANNVKIPFTKKEIYQRYLAKDGNHDKYLQKQKDWYQKNKEELKIKAVINENIIKNLVTKPNHWSTIRLSKYEDTNKLLIIKQDKQQNN